ncbi:hypothetical protein, partial [Richelia sinica]|uniref:hypothetical protein n=1 Tax=Richelia sinica TaxID=1357545 RepID=UPI001F54C6A4
MKKFPCGSSDKFNTSVNKGLKYLNPKRINTLINIPKPEVLNVKKNAIKTAQNMLDFGRNIKVYLFDSDYKFI